jgi:hypothetical protein
MLEALPTFLMLLAFGLFPVLIPAAAIPIHAVACWVQKLMASRRERAPHPQPLGHRSCTSYNTEHSNSITSSVLRSSGVKASIR